MRFVLVLCPLLVGCYSSTPKETVDRGSIESTPLMATGDSPDVLFQRLAPQETGVTFVNRIDTSHEKKYLYASAMACGGVAIGDVDGDNQPDIYLTSGPQANRLFRQTAPWQFEDVTSAAQVDGGGAWSAGAAMADVDGDGDLDIYVCNYDSPNVLYINQGDGTFDERAKSLGVDFVDAGHTPTFCDYDRDGDLDFYLLTNFYYDPRGKTSEPVVGMIEGKPSIMPSFEKYYGITKVGPGDVPGTLSISHSPVGQADRLVRNNGDGSFMEVGAESGITGVGRGNSATWWDYNEDGWPDLYVGNDFEDADRLYRNNGNGTFTDVLEPMVPHTTWYSMGADFADLDGDAAADFVIADMSGTNHFKQKTAMGAMSDSAEFLKTAVPRQYMRNVVYVNSRKDRFMEAAHLTGLANSDWTWTVRLADFDNDGRVDVFFTNGMAKNLNVSDNPEASKILPGETEWDKHVRAKTPELREQNLAFRNLGELRFEDVTKKWGLDHVGMSYSAATADLDRDGDLDVVVANLDEPVSVYRNESSDGHRVLIRLQGVVSNRWGVGAKVTVTTASGSQTRELTPVRGYMASHEPLIHLGLGEDESIQQLTVHWPSGHVQSFADLPTDQFYVITEPSGLPPKTEVTKSRPTMFRPSQRLAQVRHRETAYDDFLRQPLLPNQLSQLGPGMAWGDIDLDGDDDLWIGGAKGYTGQICRNDGHGKFTVSPFDPPPPPNQPDELPYENELAFEDMAGVWLDSDRDGDLDLYVVSGGVECEPNDESLRDRLYLNDGTGSFSRVSNDHLPNTRDSGSAASAADFDRDGDVDLFVGGRVIPGEYPRTPRSRLLRNDGGRFVDATEQLAPELQNSGLVTGAVWSDADGDGWVDLLVAHEWGPVKLYRNQDGRLVDTTHESGLSSLLGWWNAIAAADVDNDGDMDFALANFGQNTKYHASRQKPTLLYYGDFEGDGRHHIVEAEFEDETLFPVRGKSCSTHAMPHLANRFTTYTDFALADLAKIYTPACLDDALRLEANTLDSGILINDGRGKFKFQPLPRLAQIAPAFGIVFTDADADGNTDLYMVHNFYGPQPETGRMAGGVSLLLLGQGDGTFAAAPPSESGLIVPGDAKSVTTSDLDGDGFPDVVVTVNNGELAVFEHAANIGNSNLARILLKGKPGNPTAVGARVQVTLDDGSTRMAQVTAGEGYLAQSSAMLTFGLGSRRTITQIDVHWPDGSESKTTRPDASSLIQIDQSSS